MHVWAPVVRKAIIRGASLPCVSTMQHDKTCCHAYSDISSGTGQASLLTEVTSFVVNT